jgi:hypothetical protein
MRVLFKRVLKPLRMDCECFSKVSFDIGKKEIHSRLLMVIVINLPTWEKEF